MKNKDIEKQGFKKVIRPASVLEYRSSYDGGKSPTDVFIKIEYATDKEKGGRLSLSGVIGPRGNGDAWGSCGQIDESLKTAEGLQLAPGWTKEKFQKLLDVWDRWHLNDMRAACEHQRAAGWLQLAGKKVTLYNFRLSPDILEEIREAEAAALDVVKTGQPFTPSPRQVYLSNLPHDLKLVGPAAPPEYVPNSPQYKGDTYNHATEEKTLGWLRTEEHPDGLLCRACPTCGYKYGSSWLFEKVPADVLAFLQSLPDADKVPAWV